MGPLNLLGSTKILIGFLFYPFGGLPYTIYVIILVEIQEQIGGWV